LKARIISALSATLLGWLLSLTGCVTLSHREPATWPLYALTTAQAVPLNLPGGQRFDASGLLLTPSGELLTVSDRGPTLYRIALSPDGRAADLIPLTDCFTPSQLAAVAPITSGHYDCEGIAQDEQGRLYICEETHRWILRCDPKAHQVERLAIDWSPVQRFFSADPNASFEGITVGNGRLYVVNERSSAVIIVVDLVSFRVLDCFVVCPHAASLFGILHYSDLSWHDGKLFVLCRQHRAVLEVEPRTHAVLAEFDYGKLEDELGYRKQYPAGLMEGLAVDRDYIWLVTDNNGFGRAHFPSDKRPTLVKCARPDRE
jgi:uncharacterized protein YjiK